MPFGKEGGMPCATIWNLNNVQRRVLQRSTGVWEKASHLNATPPFFRFGFGIFWIGFFLEVGFPG
jgi:hypothetical protein